MVRESEHWCPACGTPDGPPTATPTRGPVCRDGFEGDNDPGGAKVIDVNTSQERALCPAGDVDWIVFGGVQGKVYTIDISRQDPGIDTTLELFDENLNSIAFNGSYAACDNANPDKTVIGTSVVAKARALFPVPAAAVKYAAIPDMSVFHLGLVRVFLGMLWSVLHGMMHAHMAV